MPTREALDQKELSTAIRRIAPLTAAFDLLAEHVLITDSDGHILYANNAAERATGFSFPEMLGKNPSDLWGGHMGKRFYRDMWGRIKDERKPFIGEVRNLRKDGIESWQELRISPILNAKGEVDFFIGIESVITDRKHREDTKENLASVVSHEALSPLTVIRWNIEWLLHRRKMTPAVRRRLEEMANENRRTIEMFHDLAHLSRVGRGYPEHETIDLAEEIPPILSEATVPFRCTKSKNAYPILTIPSLAREFFRSLPSSIAENTRSGAEGTCALARRGKHLTVRFAIPAKFLKKPDATDVTVPALIARYLRWGVLKTKTTPRSMEWSINIPLAGL